MNENEYIELQNLLTKLRVQNLKLIGDLNIEQSTRDKSYRMIRYIDFIRNNASFEIGEENK